MNFIVGLTGGIGSGKSTAAEIFASLSVAVVDTDVIAHELTTAGGTALPAISAAFGSSVLRADGGLDRAAMRRLAFADPSAKARLEAILHPMIRRTSETRCRSAADSDSPYVMLVVPLLVESGVFRPIVDRVLVVDCDEAVQISRVMARSALSVDEARTIMATQASRAERLAAADDVLTNDAGRENLSAQIALLHPLYLELTARKFNANRLNADC
jgi:dephospho-CoA kinase